MTIQPTFQWWRAHHGISNDSKLAVVALRANAKRGEVLSAWVACLDYASQNLQRGSVLGLDAEQISVITEIPIETAQSILDTFRERQMIQEDGTLTSWEKRQSKREREDDYSTDRTRAFRQRKRHETPGNAKRREERPSLD